MAKKNQIKINELFNHLQSQMLAKLGTAKVNILHPVSQGDAHELNWIEMLNAYMPTRYRADKAFVIDSQGNLSQQIDVVIYDRHYSPFLFNQDGTVYVPAESVYAVLEVKPNLSKKNLEYAGKKAASVRKLKRTSTSIPTAGGELPPKEPHRILAGILSVESSWNPPLGKNFQKSIDSLKINSKIDFGCALKSGSFRIQYEKNKNSTIEKSTQSNSLIFFFLTLLSSLKKLATVPAIDISEYEKAIKSEK